MSRSGARSRLRSCAPRLDRIAPSPLRSPPSEREGRAPLEPFSAAAPSVAVDAPSVRSRRAGVDGGEDAGRHARGGAAMRVRESEGATRAVVARCARRCGCECRRPRQRPPSCRRRAVAAPAASASSAASLKLKVCGPITTGQPQAAASIRFWPPSGAKLPPSRATSASAYQAGISPHRIAEPDVGGAAAPAASSPRQALRRDSAKPASAIERGDRVEALRMARHDDQQRPRLRRCRAMPRAASPPRLRASTRRARRRAPRPSRQRPAAREQRGVGRRCRT